MVQGRDFPELGEPVGYVRVQDRERQVRRVRPPHHGARYGEVGALKNDPDALAVTLAVETLRNFASPDADHPDYREEWRPGE
jgi:uncharacterized protein DUF6221